jgi:O-acetylhomoserine/O-acetylserine sulfhydrylase-like pyridoxal-dependent enzyme
VRKRQVVDLSAVPCSFEDAEQARALFADEYVDNIYSRFSNPNVNEFVDKMWFNH